MQAQITSLVQSVVDAAEALDRNHAIFLPGEMVVARSNAGRLHFGSQWAASYRGDALEMLRDWLTDVLDHRQVGYLATRYANGLRPLNRPVPGRVVHGKFIVEPR